jgi:multimeric flavodoxin WrbA
MEPEQRELRRTTFGSGSDQYVLSLLEEDFSAVYPGMVRYTLRVTGGNRPPAIFHTNSYEYTPSEHLTAEAAALRQADAWNEELKKDPGAFFGNAAQEQPVPRPSGECDLVILQGSPRPDGNCGTLALWASGAAQEAGRSVKVIYPHDLDIHCCIGCYQCYNTGTCVFDDDMRGIIDAIRGASLVIVCSPVYTSTVTAGLKLVIDRMQAYHAERVLYGGRTGQRGLVFSVAGRKGEDNFTCITKVIRPFLNNLGIIPSGQILIDRADAIRDIRTLAGLEDRVRELVKTSLQQ